MRIRRNRGDDGPFTGRELGWGLVIAAAAAAWGVIAIATGEANWTRRRPWRGRETREFRGDEATMFGVGLIVLAAGIALLSYAAYRNNKPLGALGVVLVLAGSALVFFGGVFV